MKSRDPYATLGIDKTATPERIKRAYRRKAAAAHPDNQTTGSDPEFRAVNQAYKLLSDPQSKQIYDETGLVKGEDKLTEAAIMLIVEVASGALQRMPEPSVDLPRMIKASLAELQKGTKSAIGVIDKTIAQIEKRWSGGDEVKAILLMNMHARVSALQTQTLTQDRAKQLIDSVKYAPAETEPDRLLDMFFARQRT